jgi:hypothetical protein
MALQRRSKADWIVTWIVLAHLLATVVATICLVWLGNWERFRDGLILALRIIWGCWIVHLLAATLTRVTIFGWSFRRYFRWSETMLPPPPEPLPADNLPRKGPLRPAQAPWRKSSLASFSITVMLVSVTGLAALGHVVLWILADVLGDWVYGLVVGIIWSAWWVLCIAIVLTRVAIFAAHKKKSAGAPSDESSGVSGSESSPQSGNGSASAPLASVPDSALPDNKGVT